MQTGSLIKYLTEKKTEGIQAEKLAYIFHQKLADLIICGCRKIRKKTKCNCVALSGGVFQNRLLLRMVEEGLEKEHFTVLRHHLIPANDGGIALGQAAYGAKREVSSELLEDLEPGDYVMVHAGIAIAKITDEDDSETEQLMEELL